MALRDRMQEYVNMSYSELFAIAKPCYERSFAAFVKMIEDDSEKFARFMLGLLAVCVGVDGQVTALEGKFINDITELDFDSDGFNALVKTGNRDEVRDSFDKVVDCLPADVKSDLCTFFACVMAVDETVTRSEFEYLDQLLG